MLTGSHRHGPAAYVRTRTSENDRETAAPATTWPIRVVLRWPKGLVIPSHRVSSPLPGRGRGGARRADPPRSTPDPRRPSANGSDRRSAVTLCAMQGRATNLGNVVSLLGAFVATAMVMGLLAAGLLIPAVGATGSAANVRRRRCSTTCRASSRPPRCRSSRRSTTRAGGVITTPQEENRIIVHAQGRRADHAEGPDRDRGQPVLRARRRRPPRHHARAGLQRPGRRHPGRVHADPAVRQAHAAGERPAQQRRGGRAGRRRQDATRARSRSSSTRSPSRRR